MYWNLLLIVLAASNCGLVGAEGPTEDAGVSDSEFFLEYNKLNKKIAGGLMLDIVVPDIILQKH